MSYNPYSLEGKTIFMTGASSGIGRSTAIECSKLGAKLIITGRNIERLQQTFERLEGEGHILVAGDLVSKDDINSIIKQLSPLDGVVCNAGIPNTLPIQFIKDDVIQEVFGSNLISPIIITKELIKKKLLKSGSSIIFTSSIGHYRPTSGNSLYGTTKAAIEYFSKYVAKEMASKKIRCNSVHPGMVETPLIHRGNFTEAQLEEDAKRYPLKRFGRPEEIAWAIIYLLSDASSWVTGHSLVIDGGMTMR